MTTTSHEGFTLWPDGPAADLRRRVFLRQAALRRKPNKLRLTSSTPKPAPRKQALTVAVTTTADALRKTNEKAKLATKERDAAIDSGALRLRVKATCPVPAATDPSVAAGDSGGAPSAELDREIAKALVAITDEGNRAIEKLNACITMYNNARSAQ
jgi:hypothetical protein